ncbi:MAG TPA: group III truncated hemoglobin [Opitutaceae bacterium]
MKDIETEADIRLLVDEFYAGIRSDALLNPIFAHMAKVNWAEHLPRMYAFWNAMVLGIPGYAGRPFALHAPLPVSLDHFERWLGLFRDTVDRLFVGPSAQRAKDTAASVAHTFSMRMGLLTP